MLRIYTSLSLIAVAGLLGWTAFAIWDGRSGDLFADCRQGVVGGGDIGGPFDLTDQHGSSVSDKDILAKPALIYFGFASCTDVCPMDNARNAEAVDQLSASGFEVTPVFITIDPDRDTPTVLSDYVANLHPKMVGLTGTDAQIKAVTQAYKAYFKKQPGTDGTYEMDHSTFTYLMLPGFGFADFFKREVTASEMADRTSCFMKAQSRASQ